MFPKVGQNRIEKQFSLYIMTLMRSQTRYTKMFAGIYQNLKLVFNRA